MRALAIPIVFASVFVLTGCGKGAAPEQAAAPAAPPAPVSTVTTRQIMLGLVIPAADIVWGVGSQAPADDAAWEKVAASAAMIAEAGNLMSTGTRVLDQGDWLTYVKAMQDAATAAAAGATAKNVDQTSDAGNMLYDSCDTCHMKYMTARQGEAK
ncbi:MAG: hypothetical protein ABL964_06090 [Steroidobacteraceae bacterium]